MGTRIITAAVATALFIPVLVYSHTYAFPVTMSLLAVIAVYEMLSCLKMKNIMTLLPSGAIALALPVLARYYGEEIPFVNFTFKVFIIFLFYLLVLATFSKGKMEFTDMTAVFVTVYLIVMSFSSMVLLRDYEHGKYIYLLVFLCPWVTDSFAYFTGYFFGRHKLIPDVSPKKTVEGAVGGSVCCVLFFVLYGFLISLAVPELRPNYPALITVGLVMSVISQCGDLVFSLIKRKYGIKDYGKLLPGHGGILDRFDSVISTVPFVLIMFDLSGIFRLFYTV